MICLLTLCGVKVNLRDATKDFLDAFDADLDFLDALSQRMRSVEHFAAALEIEVNSCEYVIYLVNQARSESGVDFVGSAALRFFFQRL